MKSFLLPDLGEGLTEASVVNWLVAEGDTITIDQPVVEVESAKAVVELPSPFAGVVSRLHAGVGETIQLGDPVISVVADDDRPAPEQGPAAEPAAASSALPGEASPSAPSFVPAAAPAPDDSAEHGRSGAVLVGYGTTTATTRLARPAGGRFRRRGTAAGAPPPVSSLNEGSGVHPAPVDPSRRSRVVSPLVRRLALDNGFDASHLAPTAPDGVVRREDVQAAITAVGASGRGTGAHGATPEAEAAGAAPDAATARGWSDGLGGRDDAAGVTRIPITGMRAAVSEHLSRSRREVPEATIWLEVDATGALALREQLREETGERFSMAAIIGRFAVAALRKYPVLNANISADGREVAQYDAVNLGIAAQTARGLVVPVIHDASALSLRGLRDAIDDIARNHADGIFPSERLRGGTFTLNNYGGFGVDGSAPILNHPEVAMLGIGRMLERPWVVDGEIVVRTIVTLTLVFDHRVCDGDVASGFITTVAKAIERPTLALADL
ncbi:dihydrolipoamide acetyltransferase component of pyruvate dehydrogenase complex [Pseudoclavibacter endophyticus]|uniref:Dihydrolipoamide acetyltransferase component of pyruvate dehydrogenase complex n=1 Tax=Pseudoclavibacter endophyticus TaxID=1778590 RepID=A0A6H9WTR2_9MICO|nr:dihydrolipoamide acetyltransferase family protein [Pseudoclavibacter endophyticus]KAB1649814.1 2-oxo acid dehydrogenase subunit E2 [Pseudoclavibacter endophyticus]GGA59547.1 dihydrolipoamide acetyltransferase component of pyruvate dehydrogenase complex [Pseudoclavibacter endophyticus]